MLRGGNPLTVGVGIIIEVIRKNNSDYDPDVLTEAENEPSSRDPIYLGTLLRLFADNVPKFMSLIMDGPSADKGPDSTFGAKLEPLGFDRFKTCELMAELLHCSNMGLLNEPGSEQLIASRDSERHRLRDAGILGPVHDQENSADDLTMRTTHGAPDEGRRLEITNPNEDGFEEVEPSRDANDKSGDANAGVIPIKDDDDFVDEPLSSPRLDASKDKVVEQQFENPEFVVAPLSPSKATSPELAKPETSETSVDARENSDTNEQKETSAESSSDSKTSDPVMQAVTADTSKLAVASPTDTFTRDLSPHPEDTPAPLFSSQPSLDHSVPNEPLSSQETSQETSAPAKDEATTATQGEAEITIAHVPEGQTTEVNVGEEHVVGDYLKMQFVDHRVVPVILSFFFKYPWNNFLHNVVYDIVQQVFNGPMDRGYNPTLAVSLFEAADITTAIINGQQASDESQTKTKTRMGYMGHLTLIAEEVVKFTERHPPELLSEMVLDKVMSQGWINYVEGALAETRERDNAILGGVRPEVALGHRASLGAGGLGGVGLTGLGNTSAGSAALADAGLNGGLDMNDNGGNGNDSGIGPFTITGGGMISGFGSSSDEDDDGDDVEEEDVNSEVSGDSFEDSGADLPVPIPPPAPPQQVIVKSPEQLSPGFPSPEREAMDSAHAGREEEEEGYILGKDTFQGEKS
jgi:SIT4-associating protein SAP185/190